MSLDFGIAARPVAFKAASTLLAALLASALAHPAWADSETRQVAPFHAVSIEGAWTADITVGKETGVVLEGDKDALKRVKTVVDNGALNISLEHGWIFGLGDHGKLIAHITTPNLDALTRSGSGDVTVTGLTGDAFTVKSNGSGSVKASGNVGSLTATINGSGTGAMDDLTSDRAAVTINGSGQMVVQPRQSLTGRINGSGEIRYVGKPVQVSSAINGSGSIEQR